MASADSLDYVVADAAAAIYPPLQARYKQMAAEAGWPAQVVDSLYITFDGNDLLADQPDSLKQIVDDLEYGKGENRPNSVIRSLKYRSDDIVREVYLERSLLKMFEVEDVFGG